MFDNLPKPFFALAPMDDVTDSVFRQIVAGCAKPDLFFTEFVNVDGLQSPGRPRLMHKLRLTEEEKPVIAQIWGLSPANYYKTTLELKAMGFAGVDINMGCPVKTVIKNGACAALINNRELAGEIIDAVQTAAGSDFPVSVKTRVGFTTIDMSWLEFVLYKKLNMLTIHGRTAKQLSKAPADWRLIGQAAQLRNHISPATLIVGNGDAVSLSKAAGLADQYGLDGVMIGRGIFSDPYIFSTSSQWQEMPAKAKLDLFLKHIKLHQETYQKGERRFETLRKFSKVYINGFEGASALREEFMQTSTPDEATKVIKNFLKPSYSYRV
jgi:tRNA-dihydrouridine synthase